MIESQESKISIITGQRQLNLGMWFLIEYVIRNQWRACMEQNSKSKAGLKFPDFVYILRQEATTQVDSYRIAPTPNPNLG